MAVLTIQSTRTFYMEMSKVNPNNDIDFAGKLYTLMFMGATVPALHGLTTNIHANDVASGMEIIPYRRPAPYMVDTYYYLLYEQKTEISLAATAGFTQTTCPHDRCLDGVVQAFISVNELQLAGATWIRATSDDYVECML